MRKVRPTLGFTSSVFVGLCGHLPNNIQRPQLLEYMSHFKTFVCQYYRFRRILGNIYPIYLIYLYLLKNIIYNIQRNNLSSKPNAKRKDQYAKPWSDTSCLQVTPSWKLELKLCAKKQQSALKRRRQHCFSLSTKLCSFESWFKSGWTARSCKLETYRKKFEVSCIVQCPNVQRHFLLLLWHFFAERKIFSRKKIINTDDPGTQTSNVHIPTSTENSLRTVLVMVFLYIVTSSLPIWHVLLEVPQILGRLVSSNLSNETGL